MQHGVIYDICKGYSTNQEDTLFEVLKVLAHTFCPVRKSAASLKKYALSPLREDIVALLQRHNKDALAIYSSYCFKIAAITSPGPPTLPLGQVMSESADEWAKWAGMDQIETCVARSPFSALSGRGKSL